MNTVTPSNKSRLPQIDFLRGVAILLVIGRHGPLDARQTGWMLPISGWWARFGWTGVDLFFVLSGFLVGGLLFNELKTYSKLDVGRFLIRRGFKIWPAYFIYLGFVFLVLSYESHGGFLGAAKSLLPNVLHLQNYLGTPRAHTWSLAVEEHFYLLLPFVLLWVIRPQKQGEKLHSIPAIPIIAVCLMVVCTLWRCFDAFFQHPISGEFLLTPTHLRIDSLFCGVLLSYWFHFQPEVLAPIARHPRRFLLLGLALVSPMMILRVKTNMFVPSLGVTLLYLGYGCILLATLYTPMGSGRGGKFLASAPGRAIAAIGTFSYSIYLWHYEIALHLSDMVNYQGLLVQLRPELRWVCIMAGFLLASLVVGVGMALLIEKPTLALRNRLFPGRAKSLPDVSPLASNSGGTGEEKTLTPPELGAGGRSSELGTGKPLAGRIETEA